MPKDDKETKLYRKYVEVLGRHGVKLQDFKNETSLLGEQFKQKPKFEDVIWSLFNKQALVFASDASVSLERLSYLYFDMSMFLLDTNQNPAHVLKEANKYKLLYLKDRGYSFVSVSVPSYACEHCQSLKLERFRIEDALHRELLPVYNCTCKLRKKDKHSWCNCYYVAVPK